KQGTIALHPARDWAFLRSRQIDQHRDRALERRRVAPGFDAGSVQRLSCRSQPVIDLVDAPTVPVIGVTLRGNASVDEAERPVGDASCLANLFAVGESPAKFEAPPLSSRGVKVRYRRASPVAAVPAKVL